LKIVVLKDMEGTEIEFDEDDCFQAKCDDGFSLHLGEDYCFEAEYDDGCSLAPGENRRVILQD